MIGLLPLRKVLTGHDRATAFGKSLTGRSRAAALEKDSDYSASCLRNGARTTRATVFWQSYDTFGLLPLGTNVRTLTTRATPPFCQRWRNGSPFFLDCPRRCCGTSWVVMCWLLPNGWFLWDSLHLYKHDLRPTCTTGCARCDSPLSLIVGRSVLSRSHACAPGTWLATASATIVGGHLGRYGAGVLWTKLFDLSYT